MPNTLNLSALGLKTSPYQIPLAQALELAKSGLRAKRYWRVVYRHSSNGGQKWSSWMRFHPEVEPSDPTFGGSFGTKQAALTHVKKVMARYEREKKAGKAYQNFGGGLVASYEVGKGEVRQFILFEELVINLSDEEIK